MRGSGPRLLHHLAGAAAASGLALAGLVMTAAPASAAACSGTSGVTVVVDTGGSVSTRCASGDPSSGAQGADGGRVLGDLPAAVSRAVSSAASTASRSPTRASGCLPADAYWAFFHATRGGGWTYSSSGVSSYNPGPGTVVGFRFGSGQQPRVAPPAPTATSAPAVTTTKPAAHVGAPDDDLRARGRRRHLGAPRPVPGRPRRHRARPPRPSFRPRRSPSRSAVGVRLPPIRHGDADDELRRSPPQTSATGLAAAPTAEPDDGSPGVGSLVAAAALLALVGGGAGWTAWKRRA